MAVAGQARLVVVGQAGQNVDRLARIVGGVEGLHLPQQLGEPPFDASRGSVGVRRRSSVAGDDHPEPAHAVLVHPFQVFPQAAAEHEVRHI